MAISLLGTQAARATDPFAPASPASESKSETTVLLRMRWVELSPDPLLSFAKNPTVYSRDDAHALVAGLVLAKLATPEEPTTVLRVTPSRSANVTYTDRKPAKGEQTDSVIVNGAVFTTRNTGVEVELTLIAPPPEAPAS